MVELSKHAESYSSITKNITPKTSHHIKTVPCHQVLRSVNLEQGALSYKVTYPFKHAVN